MSDPKFKRLGLPAVLKISLLGAALSLVSGIAAAQGIQQTKGDYQDKFRQLDEVLPTPNVYRNAAGQPGHEYWQQKVDYKIDVTLNEDTHSIQGSESISYQNNSPDTLNYLWLQLDQNRFRNDSIAQLSETLSRSSPGPGSPARVSLGQLREIQYMEEAELGYDIQSVVDGSGNALSHTIVGTLMRVDLARPLRPGAKVDFKIDYAYNIVNGDVIGPRAGYEYFADEGENGNTIYALAQWFPRLVAYTDYEGWTNKEFLGSGEFTLEFGDYDVAMTVPADHIVAATGELENASQVLTDEQRRRLREAETAERPVLIVTPEEALANEAEGTDETKTWRFSAKNVRDFAWSSSRKYIWDAKGYRQEGAEQELVLAMSFWPKEGGDLWAKYSTESVIHTLEVYSRFSFDYPYPTAQSVNIGFVGGMEYPMITFNGPRTPCPLYKSDAADE